MPMTHGSHLGEVRGAQHADRRTPDEGRGESRPVGRARDGNPGDPRGATHADEQWVAQP